MNGPRIFQRVRFAVECDSGLPGVGARPEPRRATIAAVDERILGSAVDGALLADEVKLWAQLHALVDSLPEDKIDRPGYFEEGWSAKDLVAHVGTWLAEAAVVLERIRFGTYRREEIDIDATNAQFFEAMHDVRFTDVRVQGGAARNQMLRAWGALDGPSEDADWWIRKAGPDHYAEHLPRLEAWVAEISPGQRRT